VGARLYHVATDWQLYFAEGRDPMRVFYVWEGGLGIWGGVAFGALGAWIGCRTKKISLAAMADTSAPYIVLAQGIGRLGNWFNQELFGRPTTLPWGLEIAPGFRPEGYEKFATFHPAFLYELLWDVGVCLVLLWAIRKFRLGHGRGFALYVALYTLGRGWIEYLRIDEVHNHILGLRFNVWTSAVLFVAAIIYIVLSAWLRPGVETDVEPPPPTAADADAEPKDSAPEEAEEAEDKAEEKAEDKAEPEEPAGEPAEAESDDDAKVNAEAKSEKPE
jgi:prolipoprotein diacylglyceryl transferase